jgi:hypothetical protein
MDLTDGALCCLFFFVAAVCWRPKFLEDARSAQVVVSSGRAVFWFRPVFVYSGRPSSMSSAPVFRFQPPAASVMSVSCRLGLPLDLIRISSGFVLAYISITSSVSCATALTQSCRNLLFLQSIRIFRLMLIDWIMVDVFLVGCVRRGTHVCMQINWSITLLINYYVLPTLFLFFFLCLPVIMKCLLVHLFFWTATTSFISK